MSQKINDMTPMDVGCVEMIPYGNLNTNSPGSYGSMLKAYQDSQASKAMFRSSCTMCPDFKPGYSNPAFGDNWQTFSNVTGNKK